MVKSMVGVVPQEINFSMFEKVIDIVVWQAGYFGIPRDEALPRAEEVLEKLGLGDKKNMIARTLSGGMKRRLMIARALIHKPQFLILDEPTAGVDVELRHGMWEYLKKLNEEEGVTILLTTHYLEEVEQMCRNAAIIKTGEIIREDKVKNLLNSVEKETYLIDTKAPVTKSKFTIVDENTLEVVLKKGMPLNAIISQLSAEGIEVAGIRPRGNRLEDLFLNILNT
jgi:ABC-2 type transport system ATP-binding protein